MSTAIIDLQARKRQLLAQSQFYRENLVRDVAHLNAATSWITTTMHYARRVTPILAMAVPIAGFFFRSRKAPLAKPPPKKKNLLGTLLAGYKIARQVKPIWDGFHRSRAAQNLGRRP